MILSDFNNTLDALQGAYPDEAFIKEFLGPGPADITLQARPRPHFFAEIMQFLEWPNFEPLWLESNKELCSLLSPGFRIHASLTQERWAPNDSPTLCRLIQVCTNIPGYILTPLLAEGIVHKQKSDWDMFSITCKDPLR